MKKHRLLSIILSAALMLSMLPAWTLTAHAASGTVTFTAGNETNIGQTLQDGTNSNDISDIELKFFNAANPTNAAGRINTGSFVYFDSSSSGAPNGAFSVIDLTTGNANTANVEPPQILVMYSQSEFSFKSIYINDIGNQKITKIEGFLNGVSTGFVTCTLDTDNREYDKTFDLSKEAKLQNVDEIRITNLSNWTMPGYETLPHGNWAVFNNFTIGDPIIPNHAPTLTNISTLTGATEDTAYTISYDTLKAASNAADADSDPISFRVESITTGTLMKNSTAVTQGTTKLATGESLVWTPAANANGDLNAFTVIAYDGKATSATAVQVKVNVAAVNDTPVGVSTISGTAAVGQTLTAATGGISDADGLGAFSYQWQVSNDGSTGWANIAANANSSTYTVTAGEAGKYVRVAVSYTDGGNTAETVNSTAFGPNKTSQAPLVYGDITKTYGDAAFVHPATGGNGAGSISYTSSDTSVATIDANSGDVTIHKAGTTTLTATKAGDTTYTEVSKSCTLTVNKTSLIATVNDASKTYGDVNPAFSVSVTGFVNSDTAATAAGYAAPTASCAADTTTGVGTAQITISGGTAANYTFNTSGTGTLTIDPKALSLGTVTANNKPYDGNLTGSGTITLPGIINSDDVTATGTFTFADKAAETGKTVNVTGITLGGAKAGNYTLSTTSTTATANITAKPASVASVTIADKVYDGTTTASISAASLSGVIGGDKVSVDASGATATFDNGSLGGGKTVTITGLSLTGSEKNNYSLPSSSFTTTGRIINAGTVLAPTVDVAAGAVAPGTSVTISCATVGAAIYYTTDNSTPANSSTLYSGPITISAPTTIKAIAIKTGMNDSGVVSLSYTITPIVTANNSAELKTYIESPYVTTINLVSGTTYTYDGTTVTRALTINGSGATITVGTGINDTIVKKEGNMVTGPVFLAIDGPGSSLTMNNVTLHDASTRILAAINVKTGGTLLLDSVTFDGFFANKADDPAPTSSNMDGSHNNFGVHSEPGAVSTTVKNCIFGASNSFRNAIAIRNGTTVIQNNTFVGTAMPARQNQTDGFEYAIYLYGGSCTVTGNDVSGYDSVLKPNGYHSAGIGTCPYYSLTATITGNNLHDNARGIDGVGSWHTYSEPARARINGTTLDTSVNAFTVGQALKTANTFTGNADGNISLSMDQNDYYVDTTSHVEYGPPAYYDALLHLTSTNSTGAIVSFDTGEWARAMVRNAKAGSLGIEVSQDNGATWTMATTSAPLTNSSAGAAVSLAAGKTYLLRVALVITANTRPVGSTDDVSAEIMCYSNIVSATITAGGSSSSGGTTPAGQGGASVIVNGESKTAGTAQTSTSPDGKTTTTVTVDSTKLEGILASEGNGATVVIPVTGKSDTAAGVLTGEMIKGMESRDATLVIRTDSSTYTLPASEINITAVSQQFGTKVALKDITVAVSIAEPSGQMSSVVKDAAKDGGFTLMIPSVDYTVTCNYGGRTINVSNFNAYIERTIAIPDGVDPSKITTGIVVNPDGTVHHVPTRVTVIAGKYYAVINSLTNSTYSVVWNPIEFSDVTTHWAQESINNMGSRMVVSGVGNGNYEPDRNMTRAEFAAVMVRSLGLEPGNGASSFGDVASNEWYCGYVKTAAAYGIIKGYSDAAFGPDDTITREQAMTMMARAMKITNLKAGLTDSEGNKLMAAYSDSATVSTYANTSIAECIKTGVVSGRQNHTLAPKAYVTRAEVAVMAERLLQKSNLI